MALVDDWCADTVILIDEFDETLTIQRRSATPSYDAAGEETDVWAVVESFLGDWQPVTGGTMRAEAGLKETSDAVVFGPCGLDIAESDRIHRADGSFMYVNYVRACFGHYEIYLKRTASSS